MRRLGPTFILSLVLACAELLACGTDEQPPARVPDPSTGTAASGGSAASGMAGASAAGPGGGVESRDAAATPESDAQRGVQADASVAGGDRDGGADPGGPLQPISLWIAGDSTVAAGSAPCPIGWGAHFAPLFDDRVSVINRAVGGRSVRTWLYDVQTTMDSSGECVLARDAGGDPTLQAHWQEMLDGMKAGDYLFIQFGINDSSATCDRHVGVDAFKDSYGYMAQAAKERGAQPIFVTPVSSISCNGSTPRPSRAPYDTATKSAGTEYGVPVIDLEAASVALYTARHFCPLSGGDVSAMTTGPVGDFFCDDHTHFSASGARDIAQLVANAIAGADTTLAGYLN